VVSGAGSGGSDLRLAAVGLVPIDSHGSVRLNFPPSAPPTSPGWRDSS
jgi:hypothetical protein